ncbi:cupin domain-containing protein [Kitasatospora sp. NPDC091207]|uniref:cupin domain-containing protein n=1 Tax=Kitasatospora sp. NPDC091207 TaxID=3364083 RepID=UPI0037F70743
MATATGEQATRTRGGRLVSALSWMLDPVERETFEGEFWERRSLHVSHADPHYFAELLTLDDVDRLLALVDANLDTVRIIRDGQETPVSALVASDASTGRTAAVEAVYQHYRTGSTIVLNSLDRRWEPLGRFAAELGAEISARPQMNVYLTPGGNERGFAPHYDTHDVFILQVHGSKRWSLYGSAQELPLRSQPYDHSDPLPKEAEQELDLMAGDLLYLPRGTVHAGTSMDSASVHVTIGVHPLLWASVLQDAVGRVLADDVRFRTSLPLGFAKSGALQRQTEDTLGELVGLLASRLAPATMTAEAVKHAAAIGPTSLRHHLSDLEALSSLRPTTLVRRRSDLGWALSSTPDGVELEFHNKKVRYPAHVTDEVRFVVENGGGPAFSPQSIPGELDGPGRLVLVESLLREGFLTFD